MPWLHAARDAAPSARALLEAFLPPSDAQRTTRGLMLSALRRDPAPFERGAARHFTASALALDDHERVLLVRHARLGRWVQPGGHCDGDPDLVACACRELEEETGLVPTAVWLPLLDLERFDVPAAGREPAHEHLDAAFLVRAPARTPPRPEARWVPLGDLHGLATDDSLRRRARLAAAAIRDHGRRHGD